MIARPRFSLRLCVSASIKPLTTLVNGSSLGGPHSPPFVEFFDKASEAASEYGILTLPAFHREFLGWLYDSKWSDDRGA